MRFYRKLRGLMAEYGDTQKDLGDALKVSSRSISDRMTGRIQWSSDEMYAIMDRYDVPYDLLHEVFPNYGKGGREAAHERASQKAERPVRYDEVLQKQAHGAGV